MHFVFYVELYIPFCFFYLAASLKRVVSCSGGNSVLLCVYVVRKKINYIVMYQVISLCIFIYYHLKTIKEYYAVEHW